MSAGGRDRTSHCVLVRQSRTFDSASLSVEQSGIQDRLALQHRLGPQAAGLLQRWNSKASRKGNGCEQPLGPHEHWHVGRHLEIFVERDRKLELARKNRKTKRQSLTDTIPSSS
jgi:hypothetical protein